MGEWKEEPQHKIKQGRVNGWIYRIGGERSWSRLSGYNRVSAYSFCYYWNPNEGVSGRGAIQREGLRRTQGRLDRAAQCHLHRTVQQEWQSGQLKVCDGSAIGGEDVGGGGLYFTVLLN